ncbi:autophagy-related protein 16-1-like [Uloborus diversus]|uniref:autophagy-related protein 16-1-like n=1 Tax=Uloborus diversus TaxID=327109 RepID=UPI00240992BB|nr:autophagy-related protein 16-1-like [Uloborus diversus]
MIEPHLRSVPRGYAGTPRIFCWWTSPTTMVRRSSILYLLDNVVVSFESQCKVACSGKHHCSLQTREISIATSLLDLSVVAYDAAMADVSPPTNSLYESLDFHQRENLRLRVSKANLEQDVIDLQKNTDVGSIRATERSSSEKKLLLVQEDLAELHKQKGEFAQQVITLRNAVDEKEKEIALKNSQIVELEASLSATEQLLKKLQQRIAETDHNLQFIRDEYDALLITYSSVEEKKLKLEKENQELIARLIELKAVDADRLNAETELFQRNKQAKLQKELEEAAREPVCIDTSKAKSLICLEAAMPRKVRYKFDAHDGEVNAIAWTHTDLRFATAGGDRKVKVWDISLGQACLKGVAHESNSSIYSVDIDSEEALLLAASCDFASRVWSLSDMKIKHTLTGHSGKVMSAKFLGENGKVVSGSYDRTLKIWDLRRRACIRTILTGSSANDVVTSDRSGSNIISGHFDRKIRFWDMRSESSTNEILLQGRITSLDVSVDGFSLLSCVRDDTLKLIDFRMNNVVRTLSADGFLIGCDWTRAKFSPDGQFAICGSQDGAIFIWKTTTGGLEKVLREHSATVIACAWSWCGTYLLSSDKNKKAILWSEF